MLFSCLRDNSVGTHTERLSFLTFERLFRLFYQIRAQGSQGLGILNLGIPVDRQEMGEGGRKEEREGGTEGGPVNTNAKSWETPN